MANPLIVSASFFCGTAVFFAAYVRLTQNIYPAEYLRTLAQEYTKSSDEFPLKGRVAIVTGSTNGLGKEVARKLYELGCNVIIASRSKSKSEATLSEIQNRAELEYRFGNKAGYLEAIPVDTSDLSSVQTFVKLFLKTHKRLDFLVNNAGMRRVE
jgi:NADP-dependent 3-hydroxy acid dehydrogenase YdfG